MSGLFRREIPMGLATFLIAFMFFDYYIVTDPTKALAAILQDWAVIVTTMAAGVGIINLVLRYLYNIKERKPYWYLDIWTIFILVLGVAVGSIGTYGTHPLWTWMSLNLYSPIRMTLAGMIFLDIISAFYRVFRVRTKEATILFVSALVVLLGNAPVTAALWPKFVPVRAWLVNIPNTAGAQVLLITAGLGMMGFAIRLMLRHEETSLGVID